MKTDEFMRFPNFEIKYKHTWQFQAHQVHFGDGPGQNAKTLQRSGPEHKSSHTYAGLALYTYVPVHVLDLIFVGFSPFVRVRPQNGPDLFETAVWKCPQGGVRHGEFKLEAQSDIGQAPGTKIDEFMRFICFEKINKS